LPLNPLRTALRKLRSVYLNLNLRLKFTFLIGFIILVIIFLLSFAVLEAEKFVLRGKVEEICRLSVQNLSSVARDNLLIGNYAPVQDVINNMVRAKLEDFQYAFVINREGKIIAHSDAKKINVQEGSYQPFLQAPVNFTVNSKKDYSEYLQKIDIARERNGHLEHLTIGIAGVCFAHAMIHRTLLHAERIMLIITVGVILIGIFLVQLISRGLSANIISLSNGAKEIAQGNLDVDIKINSGDEIGLLATEFNNMVKNLRENLQMQKFVSRLTVDMIRRQTDDQSKANMMQKQEIAVLFSDIRGFTRLSERLEPEQLVDIVNVYLSLQSKFIEENSGVIDKFAGDQIMAIFQEKESSDQAVKSAIAIQKAIIEVNKKRRSDNQEYLTVGIGINFGTAMLGSMGASSRMDYTAIGDVVNLASKLCNFAHSGHIVVTKSVIHQMVGAYSVIKMEPVLLSGRRQPVLVYRVVY